MMKFLLSKHSRSIFIFALLSLFMCMAAGKASAAGLNPVVKIDKTSYTSSGTEVTLKLWMFNWKYAAFSPKQYNARFTGDVYLYIDDKEVANLNEMWLLISGSSYTFFKDEPGIVGKSSGINLDGTNVGTAQLQDFKSGQSYPYNSNTTDNSWSTVDLKLSFNKSFSYYGHRITVKGKWQDQSSGSLLTKDVALDNDINGFVRPINLKVQPSGSNMVFSWEQQGYNSSASTDGKWVVYKREGDNNVKVGEAAANEHSLSIEKKQYSCSKGYIMTFLPNACEGEETVCGLTTSLAATGHQINVDDICQICGHSFFRYHTSDSNMVDISNKDFGANVVSHEVVDGECVIEFDAPITKIPENAFNKCDNLTGNLVIPNTVTEIGVSAFSECKNLTGALILPNSVTKIGDGAFRSCSGFTTLKLSETLSVIPDHAFYNCSSLSGNLVIPNSVIEIGSYAFRNCTGFNGTLTLSSNLKTIGAQAFFKCSGFTGYLTLPNSVTTIGESAFAGCLGFTNLKLSDALSAILKYAFSGCTNLSGELVIPASVTEIGMYAFLSCKNLNKGSENPSQVTLPESLEKIGGGAFYRCDQIKTVNLQSLPEGVLVNLGDKKKAVSLSDNSFISPKARGTVDAISYTRQMSNDWGTLVLPYDLTLTGSEPYRLYTIENMNGDELVLKQLDKDVLAGTPCVVKRNGSEAELTFGANNMFHMRRHDETVGDMTFRGTYWTEEVNSGYVISKNSFWNVEELKKSGRVDGVKVGPFRAWLNGNGTSANAPAQLSMRIDGSTTGIDAIDAINDAEAEYYDLSGKRLDEPQKGVNIVRMKSGKTKKIIIK